MTVKSSLLFFIGLALLSIWCLRKAIKQRDHICDQWRDATDQCFICEKKAKNNE